MLLDRSVTRLAGQPARRRCVGGGAGVIADAVARSKSGACAQRLRHRPRQALSLPRPGRRSGVNRCAIQHNRLLRKVPPVARKARLVSSPLRLLAQPPRPAGSRNPCYVLRPAAWQRGHAVTAFEKPVCVLALRASTAHKGNMPRPPRRSAALGLQPCGLPLPCSPPAFPSAPQAGLPKGERRGRPSEPWVGKLPPLAQGG